MLSGLVGGIASAPIRANLITFANKKIGIKTLSVNRNGDVLSPNTEFVTNRISVLRNTFQGGLATSNFSIYDIAAQSIFSNAGAANELLYVGRGSNDNFIRLGQGSASVQQGIAIGNGTAAISSVQLGYAGANNASGSSSVAIGTSVTASGTNSIAIGNGPTSSHQRSTALSAAVSSRAGSVFYSADGSYQFSLGLSNIVTTDNTPTKLQVSGPANILVPSGRLLAFTAYVAGIKSDGSSVAYYVRKGAIKNVAGSTSLVGTIETIGTDIEDNAATDVSITANDTSDCLDITVTGITAETWRWCAFLQGVEFPYGT